MLSAGARTSDPHLLSLSVIRVIARRIELDARDAILDILGRHGVPCRTAGGTGQLLYPTRGGWVAVLMDDGGNVVEWPAESVDLERAA